LGHLKKGICEAIISLLPTIDYLNDIAGAFSWKAILAYYLGISLSIVSVILFIVRISLPKQQKH
jgi:hypothetical protein